MSNLTVKELRTHCEKLGRKPPASCRKEQLVELYKGLKKAKKNDITVEVYNSRSESIDYRPVWSDKTTYLIQIC